MCGSPFRDCLFKKLKVMIEILFRGKIVDNGEFVYGYVFPVVINEVKRWFVIPCDTFCPKDITIGEIQVEVIPETVGQFTGLTDKNGVKIFEGKDSVKLTVIGLGEGYADVVLHEGKWCIYEKTQGYAPLFDNLNNKSIIIESV